METHHYTMCGLDYIHLTNGYNIQGTEYGEGISITNISGLHKAISSYIICSPHNMRGQEVRFLRGELKISQKALADLMGLNKQAIMRYENNHDKAIPGSSDRVLRAIIASHFDGNDLLKRIIELYDEIDDMEMGNASFKADSDGWERVAA